jgi:hypothetical protein
MTNIIKINAPSAISLSKQITIKVIIYKLHSTKGIQKHSAMKWIQMLMLHKF